jgi:hypothetical protein
MKQSNILRVHTVDEHIWHQQYEPEPVHYKGTAEEFAAEPRLAAFEHVRLCGMACNAELIIRLYDAKQQGKVASVEVCTPLVVEKQSDRRKPGPMLFELGLCCWGPSQGGFHEVISSDYHSYALVWALQRPGPITQADLLGYLQQHPAWKPLTWLPVPIVSGAAVLRCLIDPRWYVDVCAPDSGNKFRQALGLVPCVQRRTAQLIAHPQTALCGHVRDCWKTDAHEEHVKGMFELAGVKPIANSTTLGLRPMDFCWRAWGAESDPVMADLRGSQRFAEFLRQTWLSEIYRGAASVPEERAVLFRPADFFEFDEEIHAYEQFAARVLQ